MQKQKGSLPQKSEIGNPFVTIIDEFREELEREKAKKADWGKFLTALDNNIDFFNWVTGPGGIEKLPEYFSQLRNTVYAKKRIRSKYPTGFLEATFFHQEDMDYIRAYRLFHKDTLSKLGKLSMDRKKKRRKEDMVGEANGGTDIDSAPTYFRYFRRCLQATVLLSANFNFRIGMEPDSDSKTFQVQEVAETRSKWYMFYNRAYPYKYSIGIGEVTIGSHLSEAEYFYRLNAGQEVVGNKFTNKLKTEGDAEYYPEHGILVLRKLVDAKECDADYRDKGPVESIFVIKKHGPKNEKILLGINASWHRNFRYPYATCCILVDCDYYDETYTGHPFGNIKKDQTRSKDLLPPEICHFLFLQTLSLEGSLGMNMKDGIQRPFSEREQLPFYHESGHIQNISGQYIGLSFVIVDGIERLLKSKLIIHKYGMVDFEIDADLNDEKGLRDRIGYVTHIEYTTVDGRIHLSLRHNHEMRYNTLNMVLGFKGKITEENLRLNGSFAGRSVTTQEPVHAHIIFQRVAIKEHFNRFETGFEVLFGSDGTLNPALNEIASKWPGPFREIVDRKLKFAASNGPLKKLVNT